MSAREAAFGSRSMMRKSARMAPSRVALLLLPGLHCPRARIPQTLSLVEDATFNRIALIWTGVIGAVPVGGGAGSAVQGYARTLVVHRTCFVAREIARPGASWNSLA
jgi:hypothetical protein